jgi:alpha 1,2-mannosyltransferase
MDEERRHYLGLLEEAAARIPPRPDTLRGHGIVTSAGLKHLPLLWILVRSLRYHGCTLPVEVWHLQGEVNQALRDLFRPFDVTFVEATALGPAGSVSRAVYQLKPHAILNSSFEVVLYLDSDNSVYRDPCFLLETEEFKKNAAIFWPDALHNTREMGGCELWSDFGLAEWPDPEFESGQILVDKSRHWGALHLSEHLNQHRSYYYRYLMGDKDTFRLAFDYLGAGYHLVGKGPDARGAKGRVWPSLLQFGPDGQPLFMHRCGGHEKWGVDLTRGGNHDLPNLPGEVVEDLFDELQRKWSGVVPWRLRLSLAVIRARRAIRRWTKRRRAAA